MTHRFFENLEDFYAAVLAGESIDTGVGATDGDHPSWLMAELANAEEATSLDMIRLVYEFSQRVKTPEEYRNVNRYVANLFRDCFDFNIYQCADQIEDIDAFFEAANA